MGGGSWNNNKKVGKQVQHYAVTHCVLKISCCDQLDDKIWLVKTIPLDTGIVIFQVFFSSIHQVALAQMMMAPKVRKDTALALQSQARHQLAGNYSLPLFNCHLFYRVLPNSESLAFSVTVTFSFSAHLPLWVFSSLFPFLLSVSFSIALCHCRCFLF